MKKSLLKLREKYSSSDYKKASNIMKNTLKLAVNYDQKKDLKKITCETLLIWGENDQATKVKDCYLMNKILYDSGMVVLKDTGHFPFIEKEKEFNIILENYLESEKDD